MTSSSVTRRTFDDVMVPVFSPASFIPVRGIGSHVWDADGREYLDFAGGIAVTALGHAHPELLRVLHDQAGRLWHVSNLFTNEPVLRLARRLVEHTFADKAFFCNSGAEANEAALKLARRYAYDRAGGTDDGRREIVSFAQSFHGRTLLTVSVGGQPKYTEGFGPLPAGLVHLPYNDVAAARAAIGERCCAVIVEPVQGEGGVIPASREFLQALRDRCDETGALLIFDEVQIGVGRSGSLYAYMEYGITPDILTTAKALGNGFPIGAMLTTDAIAAHFPVGAHGTTYGGNPLGAAIADKVIELVVDPHLLRGVRERGAQLRDGLARLGEKHGAFVDVRGCGLLLGAQLGGALAGRAKEVVAAAAEHGLMILNAGADVLRFAPSLLIEAVDVEAGLRRLDAALAQI